MHLGAWGACQAPAPREEARGRPSTWPEGENLAKNRVVPQAWGAGMWQLRRVQQLAFPAHPEFYFLPSEPLTTTSVSLACNETPTQPEAMAERRCCPFKEGGGGAEGLAAPLRSPHFTPRPRDHLSPASPRPFLDGRRRRSRAVGLPRGGRAAHAHGRTGPRRPHFLAFPPPPPRRYPVHPGHLPSPFGVRAAAAAAAAATCLVTAPPQGQVRRGSRCGRRVSPLWGRGSP